MKIVLIQPPALAHIRNDSETINKYFPSLGIYYMHEYLKNNGVDSHIFDFYADDWDFVESELELWKFDVVGITCLTYSRNSAIKMIEIVRKYNKNANIVLGGFHATYLVEQMMENYDIDYTILGEGEERLLKLIQYLEGQLSWKEIDGIAYNFKYLERREPKTINNLLINPKTTYIKDLDKLPFPFSAGTIPNTTIADVNPLLASYLPEEEKYSPYLMILSSRGCPYKCSFCASTPFWGHKWRFRSVKNVVDEIEWYYKVFGIRYFEFIDDAFTINTKRAIEICKEIYERKLDIRFNCRTRINVIPEVLIYWLKKAGCLAVGLGVESGSKKILKTIHKQIKLDRVVEVFESFKNYGIIAYPYIMVGNPGETKETIKETLRLLKRINPKFIAISITTIYPGSELYELAKKQGFISDDYWLSDKLPPYYTYEHSLKQLKKWEFKLLNYNKSIFKKMMRWIFWKFPFMLKLYKKIR